MALIFGLLQFVVASMSHLITYPGIAIGILLILWGIFPNRWIPKRSKVKNKKQTIQELYDKLNQVGKYKWPGLDWQNVREARTNINEWKTIAKRLIFQSLGQEELNNILERINYVEERNEYMSNIGGIQAFYNEKQIYLRYLEDLLESMKKYPELWS